MLFYYNSQKNNYSYDVNPCPQVIRSITGSWPNTAGRLFRLLTTSCVLPEKYTASLVLPFLALMIILCKCFARYLFQFSNISNITSDLKNMVFVSIRTYFGLKYKLYMVIHNNSMSVSK